MTTKSILTKSSLVIGSISLALLGLLVWFIWSQGNLPAVFGPLSNQQNQTNMGLPVRLVIPSIHVDANIIHVGLTADGAVDVPKGPYEVAWYQLGPRPGEQGSAVITGHYGPWRTGAHSVFDNLYQLKKGDKIYVTDDKGQTFTFQMEDSKTYSPQEKPTEVFNTTNGTHLNLITCSGDWLSNQQTYTKRLVIFSDAV